MKFYNKAEQDAYVPECPICHGPATVEWEDASNFAKWLDSRQEPVARPRLTCTMQCWSWTEPDFATMPRVWEMRTMARLMFPGLSEEQLSAELRFMASDPMESRAETTACGTCHLEGTDDRPAPRGFFTCGVCARFVDPLQSGLWTCPKCQNESVDANWDVRQRRCPKCGWDLEQK